MSEELQLSIQIKQLLNQFDNTDNQRKQLIQYFKDIKQKLKNINLQPSDQQNNSKGKILKKFNEQIDICLKSAFRKLMKRQQLGNVRQLFDLLCTIVEQESDQITTIKKSVLISFLDDMLECVGITDLKGILDIIGEKITKFGKLQDTDAFKLLRIINTLLKRISKTEDFHIRGQLQMTLTKILPLCHQSGFRYRPITINKCEVQQKQEELLSIFSDEHTAISNQFYEQFWQIQKYFMNPQQFTEQTDGSSHLPINQSYLRKLNRVRQILSQVIEYYQKNPITVHHDFSTFPLKFLKLPNLLQLQLQDGYFRAVIMIQALIFIFSIKNPKKNPQIRNNDKKINNIIQQIQINAKNVLINIDKQFFCKTNQYILGINDKLQYFFKNQQNWIGLKDNWKDKKKGFFKESSYIIKETARKLYHPEVPEYCAPAQQPSTTIPIDIKDRAKKLFQELSKKLSINTTNLNKFLKNTPKFHSEEQGEGKLTKQPQIPSFSYFLSQTQDCISSFDHDNLTQTQFSTRSEYNVFQWKAYRSLYRQNIKDTNINASVKNIDQNLKDYRLLAMVNKKREDFYEEPRKLVKRSRDDEQQQQQNKTISDQLKTAITQLRNKLIELTSLDRDGLQDRFKECDSNQDKLLNEAQFMKFLIGLKVSFKVNLIKDIIKQLDGNNGEQIQFDTLRKLLMFNPFQ